MSRSRGCADADAEGCSIAAYEVDGRIDGYAIYRSNRPTIMVTELMAATREAAFALWRFCFDLDLMRQHGSYQAPAGRPVAVDAAGPTAVAAHGGATEFGLRVVDARAALEQRSYTEAGRLTLEVRDDLYALGTTGASSWRVQPRARLAAPPTRRQT